MSGKCQHCGRARRIYRHGHCRACYDGLRASGALPPGTLRRRAALVEDVEWLLEEGGETHPDAVAGRVRVTRKALYASLRRAGRGDLLARLQVVP